MQMQKEYPAESVEEKVVAVLKTCYDPEIPVDIYELGLIYDVSADEAGKVHVTMTLTSPACPVAGTLPPEVQQKIQGEGRRSLRRRGRGRLGSSLEHRHDVRRGQAGTGHVLKQEKRR